MGKKPYSLFLIRSPKFSSDYLEDCHDNEVEFFGIVSMLFPKVLWLFYYKLLLLMYLKLIFDC